MMNFKNFTKVVSAQELSMLYSVEEYTGLAKTEVATEIELAKQEALRIIEAAKTEAEAIKAEAKVTAAAKLQELTDKITSANEEHTQKLFSQINQDFIGIVSKSCLKFMIKDYTLLGDYVLEQINTFLEDAPVVIKGNAASLKKLKDELTDSSGKEISYVEDKALEDMKFIVSNAKTSVYLSYDEIRMNAHNLLNSFVEERG